MSTDVSTRPEVKTTYGLDPATRALIEIIEAHETTTPTAASRASVEVLRKADEVRESAERSLRSSAIGRVIARTLTDEPNVSSLGDVARGVALSVLSGIGVGETRSYAQAVQSVLAVRHAAVLNVFGDLQMNAIERSKKQNSDGAAVNYARDVRISARNEAVDQLLRSRHGPMIAKVLGSGAMLRYMKREVHAEIHAAERRNAIA